MNVNDVKESRLAIKRFFAMTATPLELEGTDFSEPIYQNLKSISSSETITKVILDNKNSAVIIPIQQFEIIESLIANFNVLLDEIETRQLKELDELWATLNAQADQADSDYRNISDTELNKRFTK